MQTRPMDRVKATEGIAGAAHGRALDRRTHARPGRVASAILRILSLQPEPKAPTGCAYPYAENWWHSCLGVAKAYDLPAYQAFYPMVSPTPSGPRAESLFTGLHRCGAVRGVGRRMAGRCNRDASGASIVCGALWDLRRSPIAGVPQTNKWLSDNVAFTLRQAAKARRLASS